MCLYVLRRAWEHSKYWHNTLFAHTHTHTHTYIHTPTHTLTHRDYANEADQRWNMLNRQHIEFRFSVAKKQGHRKLSSACTRIFSFRRSVLDSFVNNIDAVIVIGWVWSWELGAAGSLTSKCSCGNNGVPGKDMCPRMWQPGAVRKRMPSSLNAQYEIPSSRGIPGNRLPMRLSHSLFPRG